VEQAARHWRGGGVRRKEREGASDQNAGPPKKNGGGVNAAQVRRVPPSVPSRGKLGLPVDPQSTPRRKQDGSYTPQKGGCPSNIKADDSVLDEGFSWKEG